MHVIGRRKKGRIKGIFKIIIKRRFGNLREMIQEHALDIKVSVVAIGKKTR